jgi:hypothetical protein
MSESEESVPSELNWVEARMECSIAQVFKALELGVQDDVDAINARIKKGVAMRFSLVNSKNGNRFSVIREVNYAASGSVDFNLSGDEIKIGRDNVLMIQATLTVTNTGKCKLKADGEELEQWQLRRKALEDLFFDKNVSGRYL